MVLDLFSGTGSATQPFVDHGCARVVRIDNDPKCRPDIVADVRSLPLDPEVRPLFVWASPPCTEFSPLTALAHAKGYRGPRDPERGMGLVRETFAFLDACSPEFYAVENVRASRRYISREFGEPQVRIGAWMLWTNVPMGLMPTANRPHKYDKLPVPKQRPIYVENRVAVTNYCLGGSSEMRSRIFRPLAEAVHRAVCGG